MNDFQQKMDEYLRKYIIQYALRSLKPIFPGTPTPEQTYTATRITATHRQTRAGTDAADIGAQAGDPSDDTAEEG